MRLIAVILPCFLFAQSDSGLSGVWKFNPERSEIRSLPTPPDPLLKVEQGAKALTVSGNTLTSTYPLDGTSAKRQVGDATWNTVTKWEGSALLVNTLVSGPANYTVMERWTRSRSGDTLTIKKTIVRLSGESESVLVYENPAAVIETVGKRLDAPRSANPQAEEYVVEKGTRVLLRLMNAVNTKHTAPGDRIYLETAIPIFVNGRLVIPRGSYVNGTVTDAHQAGRVKGTSALSVRFDSLILPNGITRAFVSLPGSVDGRGNLDRGEGKIKGDKNKGGDAQTVGQTTAAGAGIGTLAGAASGHLGMGAGIGAAAGAAAGLAGVLASRGPNVILPQGTSMELILDRDLRYSPADLKTRVQ